MKFRHKTYLAITGCIFFQLILSPAIAQPPLVTTNVDKKEILIGEQFKINVEAIFPASQYRVRWLSIPDSMEHFEMIRKRRVDTISNNNMAGLRQTFVFTSFDSGAWVFPSFAIKFQHINADTPVILYTDSIPVSVNFQPDSSNALRDIKPVREATPENYFWYWVAACILLLLLIAIAIWIYRRNKRNRHRKPAKSLRTAYEEAIKELEILKKSELNTPGQVREYHLKLVETFKRYLSRVENRNYFNKTTDQTLLILNEKGFDKESVSAAAAALRCSDAVKFAKYIPPADENLYCLQSIRQLVEIFNKKNLAIPEH